MGGPMIEIRLSENDSIEWAIKAFKRKMQRSGILRELRQKRYYTKPSVARQLKSAAAQRRKRKERQGR
jgi:small subunit ribosomal protein S21